MRSAWCAPRCSELRKLSVFRKRSPERWCALANVIQHAYRGRFGKPIDVTCRRVFRDEKKRVASGLEIMLLDSGVPVDRRKLKGRPLDEVRPGGLGLHFMKESMDVVEFRRTHGKNMLRMVKYLAPSRLGGE